MLTWPAGATAAHLTVFQLTPVLVSDVDLTVCLETAFVAAGADGLASNATLASLSPSGLSNTRALSSRGHRLLRDRFNPISFFLVRRAVRLWPP